jgi:ATP-dependent RNA circularization protein (DNA/RNA ligase family)
MTAFFRFPHTPHVQWLAAGRPRADKVLAPHEVRELLAGDVVVEEKLDGANLGFSVDEHGALRAQNRGTYLDLEAPQGQWKPLRRWLSTRREALADALFPDLMLFGEWCYAVHSVRYTRLPDWFLAFDVYDRARGEFWSAERRNALTAGLGIATVPELARGHLDVAELKRLLGRSLVTDGPAEGLYVRREAGGRLLARAKLVRAEFVQAIEEHWSKRRLEENSLIKA